MKVGNLECTAQTAGNSKNIVSMQSVPLDSISSRHFWAWRLGVWKDGDGGNGDVAAVLKKLRSPENDSQQSLVLMQS